MPRGHTSSSTFLDIAFRVMECMSFLRKDRGQGGPDMSGAGQVRSRGTGMLPGGVPELQTLKIRESGENPSPIEHKRWRRKVWCTHLLSEGSQKEKSKTLQSNQ